MECKRRQPCPGCSASSPLSCTYHITIGHCEGASGVVQKLFSQVTKAVKQNDASLTMQSDDLVHPAHVKRDASMRLSRVRERQRHIDNQSRMRTDRAEMTLERGAS